MKIWGGGGGGGTAPRSKSSSVPAYIDSTTNISKNPHSKQNNKASNIQLFEGSKPN